MQTMTGRKWRERATDKTRSMGPRVRASGWRGLCGAVSALVAVAAAGADAALAAHGLSFSENPATGQLTVADGGRPVLACAFNAVPVPAGVTGKYAVARSNYIHPLYGPGGEVLTGDFSPDHPHHRGIYWAWPEVTWKGETRDLHALQGVFARPVRIVRKEVANGSATFETENVWKWGDTEPIVKELATVSVSQEKAGRRFIDFKLRFQALAEGVTVARRKMAAYGGFNIRLSPRADQKILTHTDPPGTKPPAAWACLSGVPPQGQQTVSVAILQDPANPEYPGDWVQFANLNWLQPTFPAKGTAYGLKTGEPLVLRYRLVIFHGEADAAALQKLWADYVGAER